MNIRFATKKDITTQLTDLIYNIDKYIYPFWFNNDKNVCFSVLQDIMQTPNSAFDIHNCIVAEESGDIIGILSFIPANKEMITDYSKWQTNFNSKDVIENYVLEVIRNIKPNNTEILGLCVDSIHRRKGIGTKMFEFFLENIKTDSYSLEVLADNVPAIKLYKKMDCFADARNDGTISVGLLHSPLQWERG